MDNALLVTFDYEDAVSQLTFPDGEKGKRLALHIAEALNVSPEFGNVQVLRPTVEVLFSGVGAAADVGWDGDAVREVG